MLTAVVFDDEYIVVQGLERMIDWPTHGIELVGSAGDGYAALELFRSLRPDIVLTDIRMPGMDGLELLEIITGEAPQTYCIVFSGFNEFEYVKRAIQLGVKDYIEKPITIQSIEGALAKARTELDERQSTEALRSRWELSKQELIEKTTWDVLTNGAASAAKWRETIGEASDEFHYYTVCCLPDPYTMPRLEDSTTIMVKNGQEQVALVLHHEEPVEVFWDYLNQWSDQQGIPIGRGSTVSTIADAGCSLKQARKALRYASFLEITGVVFHEELVGMIMEPKEMTDREEDIVLSMRTGNKERFMEQIDRLIVWMRQERLDPEVAEREMLKLIYFALEAAKDSDEKPEAGMVEGFLPHVEIREAAEVGRLTEWFRSWMERIADTYMETRDISKHIAIEQARAYIENHLSHNLSLQEVANHVGMNSAYLSVLFKEVMGESYIKYLTRYRMERAKILLQKGLKVGEVSEKVGYHTYRHFSEVFKKYAGATPGQYKEQHGNPG